jgi:hypothetical protein
MSSVWTILSSVSRYAAIRLGYDITNIRLHFTSQKENWVSKCQVPTWLERELYKVRLEKKNRQSKYLKPGLHTGELHYCERHFHIYSFKLHTFANAFVVFPNR